mgnify:FL=1
MSLKPWEFDQPACRDVDPNLFFVVEDTAEDPKDLKRVQQLIAEREAKKICGTCIHKTDCLDWAIYNEFAGIWGGMTAEERRLLRRRRYRAMKKVEIGSRLSA